MTGAGLLLTSGFFFKRSAFLPAFLDAAFLDAAFLDAAFLDEVFLDEVFLDEVFLDAFSSLAFISANLSSNFWFASSRLPIASWTARDCIGFSLTALSSSFFRLTT